MPPKKSKTKRRRRQNRWNRYRSTAYQPRSAIADSQIVHLRYGDHTTVNAGAGTSASQVFSCNNIFDPDITGVGHQPLGHDEWANFYNHYVVLGSRIKCIFMPTGDSTGNSSFICSITVEDDTTTTATIASIMERTGAVYGYCGAGTGKGALTLTKKFSTKKFFSVTDVKDNAGTRLGNNFGSSPVEQAYFHLNVAAADGTSDPVNCALAVQIEYICLLSERKNLVQS